MNITANIVCYKSKTLSNRGTSSNDSCLQGRKEEVQKFRRFRQSQVWNFEKNTLKPNSPNYEYLSRIIADKASELSEEIVKLKSERKYFTASTLLEENSQRVKPRTVNDLFCEQIKRLQDEGQTWLYAFSQAGL